MLLTEIKPEVVAVRLSITEVRYPNRFCRLTRIQVLFPEFGFPFVLCVGFLRYQDEHPFVSKQATLEEQQLLKGLTINL